MSIFRKPLGAYVRNTPDWFSRNACAGFGFGNGLSGAAPAVGLFNDDTQGRSLFVFGLSGSGGYNEPIRVSMVNGPLSADYNAGQSSTFPIDPSIGALPGRIMVDLTAAQFGSYPVFNGAGLVLMGNLNPSNDAPIDHINTPHPLAIVRPGYSLAGWTGTSVMGLSFYYVVMDY